MPWLFVLQVANWFRILFKMSKLPRTIYRSNQFWRWWVREKGFDTDFTRQVPLHGNYLYQFVWSRSKNYSKKINKKLTEKEVIKLVWKETKVIKLPKRTPKNRSMNLDLFFTLKVSLYGNYLYYFISKLIKK